MSRSYDFTGDYVYINFYLAKKYYKDKWSYRNDFYDQVLIYLT